ncbi:hypothetical protein H4219_000722 [Mycoemilia scoparia]|uniref:CTLH domain-containing protein n=1 Tax=Mycoemilia scoparia TaxID=417184 RepID=A0A9W8DWP8_9FUNG|nr:hypothetical protein H4219_000722 [Mycoemilia scoparia]
MSFPELNGKGSWQVDLNRLVMNYLIIEGYKDAAEKFKEETQLDTDIDTMYIEDRMRIRFCIQDGKIMEAIRYINEVNPELLETDPRLFFRLQQQHLIELIRAGNIEDALEFAQDELSPHGEENPELLKELEKTMALLAFDLDETNPMIDLLDYTHRQKTASEINAALLSSQGYSKEPKLPYLLHMLAWSQERLKEKAQFPTIRNFVTAELEDPSDP